MLKKTQYFIKGMQRDLSISKFNPEFAYEANNIRITAREGETLMSVTNEKGTKELSINSSSGLSMIIVGTVIGYTVLNNYVILFTVVDNISRIYKLKYNTDKFLGTILYVGNLNFSTNNPIESLGIYENENILKVYWVDGINPPRVINITKSYLDKSSSIFNFIPEINFTEKITIKSSPSILGNFSGGTVQYAFSYYNLYGQESNLFYQSPIYYSHAANRGASPEEKATNSFSITLETLDTNFDYVRIYSIFRSSINGTPIVKLVADLKVSSSPIYFTDNNTTGALVDSSLLLYIGGIELIPSTISLKDNTLFLGNYKLNTPLFSEENKTELRKYNIDFIKKPRLSYNESTISLYDYKTLLDFNSYEITSFKANEVYRFGVLFLHKNGRWSEVLYINDRRNLELPVMNREPFFDFSINLDLILATFTIPPELRLEAFNLGYTRLRGVVVHPTDTDRDVICQGIVSPTVYKEDDRKSSSPYSQSSWFFRPFVYEPNRILYNDIIDSNYGTYARYVDGDDVNPTNLDRNTEIGIELNELDSEGRVIFKNFFVDSSIVTMHSPEIEFNDGINSFNDANLRCQLVGNIVLESGVSYREIVTSTPKSKTKDYGFYKYFPKYTRTIGNDLSGRMLLSSLHWMGTGVGTTWELNYGWLVSPWLRSGSLINDVNSDTKEAYAKLKYNRLSNLRSSQLTRFNNTYITYDISPLLIFDSTDLSVINFKLNNDSYTYYGNIDRILTSGTIYKGEGSKIGIAKNTDTDNFTIEKLFELDILTLDFVHKDLETKYKFSTTPVSMKYKSGKHAIFAFDKIDGKRVLLPNSNPYEVVEGKKVALYDHTLDRTAVFDFVRNDDCGLWLMELYRTVPDNIRFGGKTEEALLNNTWLIAGDPVKLVEGENTILFKQGDTYILKYDCLKTYPYTLEDENSVTEILSFYCESRINIDGRYDRNRGKHNNLSINPTNFNLFNPVYSQLNNYFNYYYLNELSSLNYFPNSITWTKEKSYGELTDTWTNITGISTLDLDGDKGEIVSLNTFNNELFCFQRRGFSNILYNSRVQIPTSDGVPIEITNGLKVNGKRYISNTIGCTNKLSIVESPSGLYFIDDDTNSLYLFNGQINSLSDKLGFRLWIGKYNTLLDWDPINYNNYKSFYDKNNNDVYFTHKDHCLCYSELLGLFTSFMSYESVPAMFNINSNFYSIKDNKVWAQFLGDYNMFYGKYQPYNITVIANSEEPIDKIFNGIEFRSDTWDNTTLTNKTFDTLDVWNEYLKGTSTLNNVIGHSSSLKRKFRVWRALIPRDNSNKRDRIRNTWAYIKLGMNTPNTYKTEFHDLIVDYFV